MGAPAWCVVASGETDDALCGDETVNTNGMAAAPSDAASPNPASPSLGTRENVVLSFENSTSYAASSDASPGDGASASGAA